MPNAPKSNTSDWPRVSVDDVVSRFSTTVDILDALGFAAQMQAFVQEFMRAAGLPGSLEPGDNEQSLTHKVNGLRSHVRWAPDATDIQRGRERQLETYNQAHNLPLPRFAQLANKSRQQIYKDIEARRLLALNVGPRGQKIPDWQLDPIKLKLTQIVLQKSEGIDNWTIYRALSDPLESLGGYSPVNAQAMSSIDDIARAVLNTLSLH